MCSASKKGIGIFEYEELYPQQIAKLRNGYQLRRAEVSHDYSIDLPPICSILHMPHEVVLTIMKFASVEAVVALSSTCRQLQIWSNDNTLWRELLTREYKIDDTCQSVIKCQDVKQELAKRWNAQVNMFYGTYRLIFCRRQYNDYSLIRRLFYLPRYSRGGIQS